jgi:hypothetical protein
MRVFRDETADDGNNGVIAACHAKQHLISRMVETKARTQGVLNAILEAAYGTQNADPRAVCERRVSRLVSAEPCENDEDTGEMQNRGACQR